tara:strand:- start:4470 stop:5300 length:831 start_codon:yes stop_codon:yes gene_type:complete
MNAGVLAKLSQSLGDIKFDVAVGESHQDAFYNLSYVNIIPLKGFRPLGKGMEHFKNSDYDVCYQMTQHATWNNQTSLLLTPSINAKKLCDEMADVTWCDWEVFGDLLEPHFRPPVFIPTPEEIRNVSSFVRHDLSGKPIIAIETGFTSNQSWLDFPTIRMIRDHYADSHEVLFVSKDNPCCQKLDGLTRRECVVLLGYCEKFFNTCSGFFVASISGPIELQLSRCVSNGLYPALENICMISTSSYETFKLQHLKDEYPNVTFAHNLQDLMNFLRNN